MWNASNVSIRSQGFFHNHIWRWHPLLKRSISDSSTNAKIDLMNHIGLYIATNNVDIPTWSLTSNGRFSVKSHYSFLNTRGILSAYYKTVWNPVMPSKFQFFTWLLSRNRLHTKENLIKKGWQGDSTCILCGLFLESCEHLFFECSLTKSVWKHFCDSYLPFIWPASLYELLKVVESLRHSDGILWRSIFSAVCWSLWTTRNKSIFENSVFSATSIINSAISNLHEWSGPGRGKKALKLAAVLEERPILRSNSI
ncbi:uncharacterized protein LOC109846057 [Asparagus officinalis]|uniref:uncharacterized protein LOC109846057 n=1 Tax=Asparagus officinalis TaxID=4686 RepID=UPI00098E17E9|nr:uncharacterized protein LOC109846057 [Asparagus officinalis]